MEGETHSNDISSDDLEYLNKVFTDFDSSLIIEWNKNDISQESAESVSFLQILNAPTEHIAIDANINANIELAESFENYIEKLQLGAVKDIASCENIQRFLVNGGLIKLILKQKRYDKKLSNHLVKLHDIVSNAFHEEVDIEYLMPHNIAKRVMASLLFCHLVICIKRKQGEETAKSECNPYSFIAPTLVTALVNYSCYDIVMKSYVVALSKLSTRTNVTELAFIENSVLISELSTIGKEIFLKTILRHSNSSESVCCIINQITKESHDILLKILVSRSSFGDIDIYKRLVCCISRFSTEENKDNIGNVLITVMQAWADPIIARAHVSAEIIHYTHLVFTLFYHLVSRKHLVQKYQQQIVEQIAKGLPNHLNSTDFRTISLAKMIVEMITESLRYYAGNSKGEKLTSEFLRGYMDDYLCKEVLGGYQRDCCTSSSRFWMSKCDVSQINIAKPTTSRTVEASERQPENSIDSDDDNEDDDLKPIESMDVPDHNQITKIVYIRDFLEKLPELKTYDETATAFKTLPNVIKHQLIYDHEQVGRDILDAVFRWENDFDQPIFDEYRKNNLCTILKTKTEGNVEHFCKYFHGLNQLQPYKKNLILDVLSTVSKEIPLKQLGVLANSAFHHILYDENCIKAQDVTVKIPLILFFSNLLSNTMPRVMVKEQMVISYLRCLTQIETESASTEQTALYAIHSLVASLEGFQFSENVQSSISDTRTWLCRLKSMEINHL